MTPDQPHFDEDKVARARAASAAALQACTRSADVTAHTTRLISESLTAATSAADESRGSPIMRRRAERLASLVGRDPAIERAKDLLCERYMISRREAFVLLRQTSQRTNQKLRLVAHQICEMYDAPEDSRRATP